jgi:DNA topoisomerase (ATP-hydrolyzing)
MPEKILTTEYSEEMQRAYLDYSMSVITSRAIPDARDGLKPVQRRVLYDMSELKIHSDKPHRKSARIVGDTMGKYHPHGDSSIYETLVVLSQAWKKAMPLVDGHGNFGSIEGDGAAAMRYTEARLKKFTEEVYLRDLDKTVKFISNYDETEKEPEVLPARVPNLLINGAEGIAVGMSTSIPTHNLGEVCELCIEYIKDKNISIEKMLEILPGPDFPTGGIIANKSELENIYTTGMGKLKLRGKVEVELGRKKSDKDKLIISEIPYTMIGSGINKFLQDIADLVESKKLPDVVDISNQSDKNGTRIVLELRKDADIEYIKNMLYKKTKLEDSFGVNMLAIVNKRPETMNLKSILEVFLNFQYENATKKYTALLAKGLEKKEIQEGLIRAYDIIDLIIAILRGSKNINDAKLCLTKGDISKINFKDKSLETLAKQLNFTDIQAQAILEMRLYRLIGLEITALLKENKQTVKNIKLYEKILSSKKQMDIIIISDLEEIKKEYATKRLTAIEDCEETVFEEIKVAPEKVIFVMDRFGYSKVIDLVTYERNLETIETEYKYILKLMNNDKVCIFTDKGLLHQVKISEIPTLKLKDKGIPIDNKSKIDSSKEEIICVLAGEDLIGRSILVTTNFGFIKRVKSEEYITNQRTVVSTKLEKDDKIIALNIIYEEDTDVIVVSNKGYVLRYPIAEISFYKKLTKGEKAMKLGIDEKLEAVYLTCEVESIHVNDKNVEVDKIKQGHRSTRGTKLRL